VGTYISQNPRGELSSSGCCRQCWGCRSCVGCSQRDGALVLQVGKRGDARWERGRGCWDWGMEMGYGVGSWSARRDESASLHAGLAVDVNVNNLGRVHGRFSQI
jgi:hypothetical protein